MMIAPAIDRSPAEVRQKRLNLIRYFLLHPQQTYTVLDLAAIWCIHTDDVRAIYHDDLTAWNEGHPGTPDGYPIAWIDVLGASVAFNIIRACEVEEALGKDFERVRSIEWPPFLSSSIFRNGS